MHALWLLELEMGQLYHEGPQRLLPMWPMNVVCALAPFPSSLLGTYLNNLSLYLCSNVSFQKEGKQSVQPY